MVTKRIEMTGYVGTVDSGGAKLLAMRDRVESRYKQVMEKRTEPRTAKQWIIYIGTAIIVIWLIIWMLSLSGINVL